MQLTASEKRAFRKLLSFRISIVLAYQIIAVVAGWHVYELTRDPLALGMTGLAEVLPFFGCTLFAGHAVDHYSRRMFGVAASLLLVINALVLAAVSAGLAAGSPTLWIYGAIASGGIARAFIGPSYNSMFALILPRCEFARAAGIGSSAFQLGLVAGPALGGIITGMAGKTPAYATAALLAFSAAVSLFSIRMQEPPPKESAPIFKSIGEGLRFVFSNQVILGALSLDMFAVLFGGAIAMLPAFIRDVFQAGPEVLGFLRATPAVGAMATGLWLARHPVNRHAGRWLLGAVAGFGLCIILFALSRDIRTAGLILMLSGICDGVSVVMRSTIIQLSTPDDMRGRVSAINGIFIGSSNELGAVESGIAARLLGLVPSVIVGGLMTLGIVAATTGLAPKLRKLELHELQ
ncbi:MAG: MFS transporter [Chlorobiaceae bacterium]|nr:MFS transporter [Chlorobiaceae bacterium]